MPQQWKMADLRPSRGFQTCDCSRPLHNFRDRLEERNIQNNIDTSVTLLIHEGFLGRLSISPNARYA
jgi:hypothetical protein